ncbi:MAG: WD40/YVTN/BNR-like repeat-containing protein, partial [Candidatus Kapaibacterium sp.]
IDSGSSWQPVALPDSFLSYSYDYAIPLTPRKLLIRIAKPGVVRVVLTENEGDNWRVVTGPWAAARMSFVDSLYGWAVGNELDSGSLFVGKDVIVQTTDGGLTWHDQVREYVEPKLGLSDVDCADRLNCIAGGGANKLVVTTDGGKTWNGIDAFSGSSVSIRGVAYPSLETAFVIGGDASILRLKRQSLTVRLEDTHQSTESVVVRERSLVIPASIHQGEPFELLTYNLLGKQCSVEQVKPHQGGVPLLLSLELLPGVYAVAIKRKEGQITTTKVILSGR